MTRDAQEISKDDLKLNLVATDGAVQSARLSATTTVEIIKGYDTPGPKFDKEVSLNFK